MTKSFESLNQEARKRWRSLNEDAPWVRIDTSIPGEAGGARAVIEAFRSGLDEQNVVGVVTEVASLGLSYADPVADVKTPGGPRVLYANVSPDQVADIISSHLRTGSPGRG